MEYLGPSIFDLSRKLTGGDDGLPLRMVQKAMFCVFTTLKIISDKGVLHGDLSPENILQSKDNPELFKLVDYHLAEHISMQKHFNIQRIFYKSPEVLLRIPFSTKIDVWSLAATGYEMFIGFPLFPGDTEIQVLYLISKMIGQFPQSFIQKSSRRASIFLLDGTMKPPERLAMENREDFSKWKEHIIYRYDSISKNVLIYRNAQRPAPPSELEMEHRRLFIDLLERCLKIDPDERLSAAEALEHPFFQANIVGY